MWDIFKSSIIRRTVSIARNVRKWFCHFKYANSKINWYRTNRFKPIICFIHVCQPPPWTRFCRFRLQAKLKSYLRADISHDGGNRSMWFCINMLFESRHFICWWKQKHFIVETFVHWKNPSGRCVSCLFGYLKRTLFSFK